MKVLIVHPCKGFYGGAEEVVAQLTNYLTTNGHKVLVILKDAPEKLCQELPVTKEGCGARTTHSWATFYKEIQREVGWADVVNVHNFPATLMTFPKKVPTVWYCHEPPELFTSWKRRPIEALNRGWVRKSKMEVVVADSPNRERFWKLYGVMSRVVPYGVDHEFWSGGRSTVPADAYKRLYGGKGDEPLRLLQVGTISHYKNQLESVCTLAELLTEGVDATLTLAGGYTDEAYYFKNLIDYTSYIDKEEVPGFEWKVLFSGYQPQDFIRELYSSHDVLLHPVQEQGGWLVPFEAMCAGLPVITTPGFSASGLIVSSRLGIVTGNIAKAILTKEYEKLDLERIRSWVANNLTWDKFGKGMVKIFEGALGGEHR